MFVLYQKILYQKIKKSEPYLSYRTQSLFMLMVCLFKNRTCLDQTLVTQIKTFTSWMLIWAFKGCKGAGQNSHADQVLGTDNKKVDIHLVEYVPGA